MILCLTIILIIAIAASFSILRAVLKGKITKDKEIDGSILSFGENHFMASNIGDLYTIHAEHDAINNLPYTKKKKTINLLVVRFTKNKKLCMSKPCNQCIQNIYKFAPRKGYTVKNIYYSTEQETIHKTTLNRLRVQVNSSSK
jgi:deoxycytidylate deaminase